MTRDIFSLIAKAGSVLLEIGLHPECVRLESEDERDYLDTLIVTTFKSLKRLTIALEEALTDKQERADGFVALHPLTTYPIFPTIINNKRVSEERKFDYDQI